MKSIRYTTALIFIVIHFVGIQNASAQIIELSDFEQALMENGYNITTNHLSEDKTIVFEEPSRAYVNIIGIEEFPQNKWQKQYLNMHAWAEIFDGNGHYFKKRVLLNGQGNSSMQLAKKNFALTFCEDEWIGNETTEICIGDWVTQNAFHFKAFYNDYFRGLGEVAYSVYDQLTENNEPIWKRAGIQKGGNACCHPKGFPCAVYLNGKFYGIFAWQTKKHHKNMAQNKDIAEHIHLDGDLRDAFIFRGIIDWTRFEIRNPKNLFCIETEKVYYYVYTDITDNETEMVLMEDKYVTTTDDPKDMNKIQDNIKDNYPLYYKYITKKGKIKFYKLTEQSGYAYSKYNGDNPKELIDETMPYFDPNNKYHIMTAKVKKYIISMSKYWDELNDLESSETNIETMRTEIAKRYDIDALLDYQIHLDVMKNADGTLKNWQWFTYDGKKWYVTPYDLDQTFGMVLQGGRPFSANTWIQKITSGPFYWITKYYSKDKELRYKKLRFDGHISVERINEKVTSWYNRVSIDFIEKEKKAWPESPCYNEPICASGWKLSDEWLKYSSSIYSDTVTYNAGDVVSCDGGVWEATETVTGVKPYIRNSHIDSLERVKKWVEERIALVDKKYGFYPDKDIYTHNIIITSSRWATICVPFDFHAPEELNIYTLKSTGENGDSITLINTKCALANKPYLINAPEGTYILSGIKEDDQPTDANYLKNGLLTGVYESIYAPKGSYTLKTQDNRIGFYYVTEDNTQRIENNCAYLTLITKDKTNPIYFDTEFISNKTDFLTLRPSNSLFFNLQGSMTRNLSKGINIIIKDGRTSKIIK